MPAAAVATERKKGAGSEFQVDLTGLDAFVRIGGIETIPQVGGGAEYDEETRIHETERSYTEKLATPQEFEIVMDDLPADTDQQSFIDKAIARDIVPAKVLYANGRIASFSLELMDHYQGEASVDGNLMCAVKGRVKSIVWSKVA